MNFKEGYSVKFKDNVTRDMLVALGMSQEMADKLLSKPLTITDVVGERVLVTGNRTCYIPTTMLEVIMVQKEGLRKRLNDAVGKNHPQVASYAIRGLDENGVVVDKIQSQDICHARLTAGYRWRTVTDVALHVKNYFTTHHFTDEQADAYKEYISWILNDSPWAMAFKTKHVWVATRYGIEMDVSVAHNIVAAAAIALRLGSEYINFSVNWKLFQKEGLTKNQAFLLASFTNVNSYDPVIKLALNTHMGGHHVVSSTQGFKRLVQFMENGYSADAKKGRTLMDGSARYSILDPIAPEHNTTKTVTSELTSLPAYGVVDNNHFGQIKGILDAKAYIQQFKEAYNAAL